MSLMDKYSAIYGMDIKEVKAWVNDYASGKVPESVKEWMEPTKEERINSIKSYIQHMVDQSMSEQIKADLVAGRIASSESNVVCECPF